MPKTISPEVWAKGILAMCELTKDTMATFAPKPSVKAIRQANKILRLKITSWTKV